MSTEVAIARLGANAARYAYALETAMLNGGILSQIEKAHFIAQMAHETQGFTRFDENLNYSAKRLREVFSKYFPTDALAKQYAGKPERIANRVYANRYGNGSESSGDGYKYRGRGFTHLTFKDNYRDASLAIFHDQRLVTDPTLAAEPMTAAQIAVWYWNSRECCGPARNDDIAAVTRKINGGYNGLEDRRGWLVRTKEVFGV